MKHPLRIAAVALACCAPAAAQQSPAPPTHAPTFTFVPSPGPQSFTISAGAGNLLVTIKPDGAVEYGPDYTPDAAARALWDAVGLERKNCR